MRAFAADSAIPADLAARIRALKEQRNAVLLVHNYQLPEVQDLADFLGDSLGLSQQAAKTDADVILFCGVHFMAETAAILCPNKTVLLPDVRAGCPMADMVTVPRLRAVKAEHPEAAVVGYVNTTAEVKGECDIACTSANAVKVIQSLEEGEILFVPDKSLADYVQRFTDKTIIPWPGFCPTHHRILASDVLAAKEQHPNAEVIAHPECTPDVVDLADAVRSTSGMTGYVKESTAAEFIICTEVGIIYRLQKENPAKRFYAATDQALCPNMKKITLEKVLWSLEEMETRIAVPPEIREKALKPIQRMLAVV